MEVYIFQGNEGEEVPEIIEKLIVKEDIFEELPESLCYNHVRLREVTLPNGLIKIGNYAFCCCENLVEVSISNTVQHIGVGAFKNCDLLTNVEFEFSTELQTIEEQAFMFCDSLARINLPSSVNAVGEHAFHGCDALTEANLSATGLTKLPYGTFSGCSSLRTVRLPSTLERIYACAFYHCPELVTVVVPFDSQSIRIGYQSFCGCIRLSNFVVPKLSTADDNTFYGCTPLHQRYGEISSRIITGLRERFENFRIHRMCYDHSAINDVQELRQCIMEQQYSLVDTFGMTALHVFFSTAELRIDLLDVLLELLPNQILKFKDANDNEPLDYLIDNWTDGTKILVERTLQKWIIDRVARWGTTSWTDAIRNKVQSIFAEQDKERRETLLNETYSAFEHYENVQATSILEMVLWKAKLKSGGGSDGAKRQALDREECRFLSGSDVVIPPIVTFLNIPLASSDLEDSEEEV